jgi:hypothetical protein
MKNQKKSVTTEKIGGFNLSIWHFKSLKDRKEFLRSGKIYVLETFISDKSIFLSDPLK